MMDDGSTHPPPRIVLHTIVVVMAEDAVAGYDIGLPLPSHKGVR